MSASSELEERIREGYEQNFFLSIGAAAVPENKMQQERGLYEKVRKSGEGKHSLSSISISGTTHGFACPSYDRSAAFNGQTTRRRITSTLVGRIWSFGLSA
jgi:hypothetical protein